MGVCTMPRAFDASRHSPHRSPENKRTVYLRPTHFGSKELTLITANCMVNRVVYDI